MKYTDHEKEVIECKHGKLVVPKDTHGLIKSLKETGKYQEHIIIWAQKYSKPNSVILDVGANIGTFTVPFAKLHGASCQVFSFEPYEAANDLLEDNVELNDLENVTILKKALSDKDENKTMYTFPAGDIGAGTLHNPVKFKLESNTVETKTVECIRLDSLNLKNISFIKVDIQEHEFNFLLGAKNTLEQERSSIVLELPERNKKEREESKKCSKFLRKIGYHQKQRKGKDVLFLFGLSVSD
jgi:FkbM family methyltransferase